MSDETSFTREYAGKSEYHARRIIDAMRHDIKERRKEIARQEKMIARSLADLNEAKHVMYERGWSE